MDFPDPVGDEGLEITFFTQYKTFVESVQWITLDTSNDLSMVFARRVEITAPINSSLGIVDKTGKHKMHMRLLKHQRTYVILFHQGRDVAGIVEFQRRELVHPVVPTV